MKYTRKTTLLCQTGHQYEAGRLLGCLVRLAGLSSSVVTLLFPLEKRAKLLMGEPFSNVKPRPVQREKSWLKACQWLPTDSAPTEEIPHFLELPLSVVARGEPDLFLRI
jgi:hypothetical protein